MASSLHDCVACLKYRTSRGVEDICSILLSGAAEAAPDPLVYEQLGEALDYCVIVTVAAPTHARREFVSFQEIAPVKAAKLTVLVAVDDGLLRREPALDGSKHGIDYQIAVLSAPASNLHQSPILEDFETIYADSTGEKARV